MGPASPQFNISQATYVQDIEQATNISSRTRRGGRDERADQSTFQERRWPLSVHLEFAVAADGSSAQTTTIRQENRLVESRLEDDRLQHFLVLENTVTPSDTLHFDPNGAFTGRTGQSSAQRFFTADSTGHCFSRELTAATGLLTAVVDGRECGH